MGTKHVQRGTKRKVIALGAAAAALGLGVSATLAAWTDTEWVFGANQNGDGPGIGTSTFEVQQNTDAAFDSTKWTDEESNPGGAMTFSVGALALTPGDATYAQVALRTTLASVAGHVTLQPADEAIGITVTDDDELLWDALELRVATHNAPFTCNDTAFAEASPATTIADGSLSVVGGSASQNLQAAASSTQYYCFEVSLPDPLVPATGTTIEDYMGLTAAPAWQFLAESE